MLLRSPPFCLDPGCHLLGSFLLGCKPGCQFISCLFFSRDPRQLRLGFGLLCRNPGGFFELCHSLGLNRGMLSIKLGLIGQIGLRIRLRCLLLGQDPGLYLRLFRLLGLLLSYLHFSGLPLSLIPLSDLSVGSGLELGDGRLKVLFLSCCSGDGIIGESLE